MCACVFVCVQEFVVCVCVCMHLCLCMCARACAVAMNQLGGLQPNINTINDAVDDAITLP